MTKISPDEVTLGLCGIGITSVLVGAWYVGFQESQTIRRILGRKTSDKDLVSISTWMQVDEQAKKFHQDRPYTAMAGHQAESPAGMSDSLRPVRILGDIGLIFFTLYLERLISPKSIWDTYQGHRLAALPAVFGIMLLYYEWKSRSRFRP